MYKNSTKERDNDNKEEVVFSCEDEIKKFFPYYYKATPFFSDRKYAFYLALCHYISSRSDNGPTFE